MSTTRLAPTLEQFQQWATDCAPAARAVLLAQAFAELERERVNAYIRPIFASYHFMIGKCWQKDPTLAGQPITDEQHLYLCDDDDPQLAAYYDECDRAHRAHGFRGKPGHCPALEAEHLLTIAQSALLDLSTPLFGFRGDSLFGEDRARALKLLIGACMKAERDRIEAAGPYVGPERRTRARR
jgi:hypothetical protein